jgi:shikimate kinase
MGWVVWLKADIDVMVARLESDSKGAKQRPAFSDRDLREETNMILRERIALYESVSDVSLDTTALAIGESVDEIIRIIHKREKEVQGRKRDEDHSGE